MGIEQKEKYDEEKGFEELLEEVEEMLDKVKENIKDQSVYSPSGLENLKERLKDFLE